MIVDELVALLWQLQEQGAGKRRVELRVCLDGGRVVSGDLAHVAEAEEARTSPPVVLWAE